MTNPYYNNCPSGILENCIYHKPKVKLINAQTLATQNFNKNVLKEKYVNYPINGTLEQIVVIIIILLVIIFSNV